MAVRNKNQLINGHRDPMAAEIVIPLRKASRQRGLRKAFSSVAINGVKMV
jgi:hypothetical protein